MPSIPDDPFNLQRFVDAQTPVYETVLRELRTGRKTTHWIWFIFPQASGLGRSAMSERYALGSHDEARAYLAHPVLGPRLRECVALVRAHEAEGISLEEIFGELDAMKFKSCVELFGEAAAGEALQTAWDDGKASGVAGSLNMRAIINDERRKKAR